MISSEHVRGLTDVDASLRHVQNLSELVIATEAKTEEIKAHRKDCIGLANKIQTLISIEEPFHVLKPSKTLSDSGAQRAFALFTDALRRSAKLLENCGRAMRVSTFHPKDATAVQEVEEAILESVSLLRGVLRAQNRRAEELLEAQSSGSTSLPQNDTSATQYILIEPPSGVFGNSIKDVLAKLFQLQLNPVPASDPKRICIPAKSFSIASGDDQRSWESTRAPGSMSDEVLYLKGVCHFDVRVTINTRALRTGTFSLVWRYQLLCLDNCWETSPVTFKMSELEGPELMERSMFLCPKAAHKALGDDLSYTFSPTGEDQKLCLCSKDACPNVPSIWVDYPIFNFTVEEGQKSPLVFSMSETGSRCKRGLFLDALVISRISQKCYHSLPKSNADDEAADEENSKDIDDAFKALSAG